MTNADLAATVYHSGGSYPVEAGWGLIDRLGERLTELGIKGPVYIVTDDNVMRPYGRNAQWALQRAGIAAHCFIIPPGEPSKTFELAQHIYEWLVSLKAERGQAIVAVGGGVVGDLAGFVAATFLRGVPFVQVPTSMAAMVDASIGGKVAVNLPQAKNLVGAFYQPKAVLADVQALSTLGKRGLSEGWAEAIKHGLILDADLLDLFEEHAEALMEVEPEISTEVIRRSMAIKAEVVSQDERGNPGHPHSAQLRPHHRPCPGVIHRVRPVHARRGGVHWDDGSGPNGPAAGDDSPGVGGASAGDFRKVPTAHQGRRCLGGADTAGHVPGQKSPVGHQPLGDAGGRGPGGGAPGRSLGTGGRNPGGTGGVRGFRRKRFGDVASG